MCYSLHKLSKTLSFNEEKCDELFCTFSRKEIFNVCTSNLKNKLLGKQPNN